ncbi:hypothetical protein CEXT_741261 [Caerostris extrusa]|uniref:Uncharacterized protein n=1 Tax=Caerostris extrusa TaxID=172846 RepID=A0AAV4P9G2_CAEEX|nr:hypothetical protein CEXT_741261 [Caerostris extrusa]
MDIRLHYSVLLTIILATSLLLPEMTYGRMMMGGGGSGGAAGVMQLLAVGLIAKTSAGHEAAKMGSTHTTKIVPLPVYLGSQGMMGKRLDVSRHDGRWNDGLNI